MKKHINFIIILLLSLSFSGYAQEDGYQAEVIENNDGNQLPYKILWPDNFDKNEIYPVLVFLHGAGERGSDNQKQLTHGADLFASEKTKADFPMIVVIPQCPADDYWANAEVDRTGNGVKLKFKPEEKPTQSLSLVMTLIDDLKEKPYVKTDQFYLGGLSMGGMGTFELLSRKPDTFAAAFAICGGGSTEAAETYAQKTPMWIFHGAKDNVVSPVYSLEMVESLFEFGAYPKFTLYEDANHNSWDAAFSEPELLPWLFSHNLEGSK